MLLDFIGKNEIIEAHHGDCVGVDKDFHDMCSQCSIKTIIHPPSDNKLRANCSGDVILPQKKYLDRNHDIVNNSDLLIAFPSSKKEILRSGTWATIRYAKKNNKKTIVIFADGSLI